MIKKLISAILFFPFVVLAQNQGDDMGLGSGGTKALGRVNDALTNVASGDGKANFIALSRAGEVYVKNGTGATSSGKASNAAFTAGDVGTMCLAVRNDASAQVANPDLSYSPISVTNRGHVQVELYSGTASATQGEDVAFSNGITLFGAGYVSQDPLTVDQGSTNDWGPPKIDRAGRTITTMSPATEMWSACSASNTGTSDTAIKAAVASNVIYVTSISCFNTAAVASSIIFKQGSTQIYAGGISNSTLAGVGVFEHSLPVPIKTASGAAFNFAMGTTATATVCCGAGYISVN